MKIPYIKKLSFQINSAVTNELCKLAPREEFLNAICGKERNAFESALEQLVKSSEGSFDAALRALISELPDRRRSVFATVQMAAIDSEFIKLTREGDLHRDAGRWGPGEDAYWRALQLYPLHPGYRVQYGHCLKEQGKLPDAELQYRNAVALGNFERDLLRHIRFVAERNRQTVSAAWLAAAEEYWMRGTAASRSLAAPATSKDALELSELLLGHQNWVGSDLAGLIDRAPLQYNVAIDLLSHPSFVHANRDLMTLVVETV